MITEGIILTLDYGSNNCLVRLPIFETVGMTESATFDAKISIQPGNFNNYKEGDSVWVGFINKKPHQPLILGKIYQSSQDEQLNSGGTLNINNLNVTGSKATLPQDTELVGTYTDFNNILSIIQNLKSIINTIQSQQKLIDELELQVKSLKDSAATVKTDEHGDNCLVI